MGWVNLSALGRSISERCTGPPDRNTTVSALTPSTGLSGESRSGSVAEVPSGASRRKFLTAYLPFPGYPPLAALDFVDFQNDTCDVLTPIPCSARYGGLLRGVRVKQLIERSPEQARGNENRRWHTLHAAEATAAIESDATSGLSPEEAVSRLERFGPNSLREPKRRSLLSVFLGQFKSPLIYLLFVAAGIALALGHTERRARHLHRRAAERRDRRVPGGAGRALARGAQEARDAQGARGSGWRGADRRSARGGPGRPPAARGRRRDRRRCAARSTGPRSRSPRRRSPASRCRSPRTSFLWPRTRRWRTAGTWSTRART